MSKQKRLFFGPLAGIVIVMLFAGMLYAPTALASAESDGKDKGKGNSQGNNDNKNKSNSQGNNQGNAKGDDKNKGKDNDDKNKGKENDDNKGNNNNQAKKVDPPSTKDKDKDKDKDNDNKCKKHKYDGVCDKKKPDIHVTSLHIQNTKTGDIVTIAGIANDIGSGIHEVELSFDGKSYHVVSTSSGPWTFTANLNNGHHTILAKAIDNAHNIARAHAEFKA